MSPSISRIIRLAGDSLCDTSHVVAFRDALSGWGKQGEDLLALLSIRNGFYALKESLLLRPLSCKLFPLGALEWNSPSLWKHAYGLDLGKLFFFAEDLFGCQYGIMNSEVVLFDPETGECESVADTLESWARVLLDDLNFRTGYPLAQAWRRVHGAIPRGCRLHPNIPFVFGGKYEVSNLHLGRDVEGMIFRASLARQIRDVPDGEQVVVDLE